MSRLEILSFEQDAQQVLAGDLHTAHSWDLALPYSSCDREITWGLRSLLALLMKNWVISWRAERSIEFSRETVADVSCSDASARISKRLDSLLMLYQSIKIDLPLSLSSVGLDLSCSASVSIAKRPISDKLSADSFEVDMIPAAGVVWYPVWSNHIQPGGLKNEKLINTQHNAMFVCSRQQTRFCHLHSLLVTCTTMTPGRDDLHRQPLLGLWRWLSERRAESNPLRLEICIGLATSQTYLLI